MKINTEVKGGDKLAHRLRELQAKLKDRNVYVGLPEGSGNYEDGTAIAVVGAVNEFGSADGRIPERSFLRVPLRASQKVIAKLYRILLPKVLNEELSINNMLGQIGAKGASISQEAISAGIDPPNAPSTIAGKGGASTPLINRGTLRQSITYKVGEEDES